MFLHMRDSLRHSFIRFIRVSALGNMVCMAQGALLSRKAERAARLRGQQNAFWHGLKSMERKNRIIN